MKCPPLPIVAVLFAAFTLPVHANSNKGKNSQIIAGTNNAIAAGTTNAAIAGGQNNSVAKGANNAMIAGGSRNSINGAGKQAFVAGGQNNVANGKGAFAAGNKAQAIHNGSFVWSDGQSATFGSTAGNQFLIRARRGVGINTNNPGGNALLVNGNLRVTGSINSGSNNTVNGAVFATLGGGSGNSAIESYSTVSGGRDNTANGSRSTVAGGNNNTASGARSVVGGGAVNAAVGAYAVVSGGSSNAVSNDYGTVSGGGGNTASGAVATVGGGEGNTAIGPWSTVGGGANNASSADYATVGGGQQNKAQGESDTVAGGEANTAGGDWAFIGGGRQNTNIGSAATIAGGEANTIDHGYGVIGGGLANSINGSGAPNFAVIGGGATNTNSGYASTIGGGNLNQATNDFATVAGGYHNKAGFKAAVAGGVNNAASGDFSFVGGGALNTNSATYAMIPGGLENTIATDASYSFAAGRRAKANHSGCFVWADSTDADFGSASTNQFLVRAAFTGINRTSPMNFTEVFGISSPATATYGGMYVRTSGASAKPYYGYSVNGGGSDAWTYVDGSSANKWKLNVGGSDRITVTTDGLVGIGTTAPTTPLQVVNATCDGNTWVNSSDRNLKTSFKPVDGGEILRKVAGLPISEWTYKSSANGSRHVGPTAQDFREIFGLGDNDKTISTIDPSGVALAAIQGLVEELKERDKEIAELKTKSEEVDKLKEKLEAFEERLNSLPPAP